MSTYAELLEHPAWQRKRLEILNQHNFTCEECGAQETTLHVHHGYYERGRPPWDYPDDSLHCLCKNCHARVQHVMGCVHRALARLTLHQLCAVYGFAVGMTAKHDTGELPIRLATEFDILGRADWHPDPGIAQTDQADIEAVSGAALAWEADPRDVIALFLKAQSLQARDLMSSSRLNERI